MDAESLKKSLEPRKSEIVSIGKNLVDVVWSQDRPERPKSKVFPLETKYSGESAQEKIRRLREELANKKVKAMVVTMLDEVAWLFNLRGADIDFNPGMSLIHVETHKPNRLSVFFAYALVTHTSATLFVDSAQIDDVVRKHLGADVSIQPYDAFFNHLQELGSQLGLNNDAVSLYLSL